MNKVSNWVKYCIEKISHRQGLALDLACGKGRHSILLSNFGFKVLSVDINKENLKFFSGKFIKKKVIDVENICNWPLEKKKFNAVIVTNFLNREIFPLILSSINKGGYLIYETFSEGQQKIGKPTNPKFILKSKELINLSSSMQLLAYEEIYTKNSEDHSFKQRIFAKNV